MCKQKRFFRSRKRANFGVGLTRKKQTCKEKKQPFVFHDFFVTYALACEVFLKIPHAKAYGTSLRLQKIYFGLKKQPFFTHFCKFILTNEILMKKRPIIFSILSILLIAAVSAFWFFPSYNLKAEKEWLLLAQDDLLWQTHVQHYGTQKVIEYIKHEVEIAGNREEDRELLHKAEHLKDQTTQFKRLLEKYEQQYLEHQTAYKRFSMFVYFGIEEENWEELRQHWEKLRTTAGDQMTDTQVFIDAEKQALENDKLNAYYFYAPCPVPTINLGRLRMEAIKCEHRGIKRIHEEITKRSIYPKHQALVFYPQSNRVYEGDSLKGILGLINYWEIEEPNPIWETSVGNLKPVGQGKMLLEIPKKTVWKEIKLKRTWHIENDRRIEYNYYSPVIIKH